MFALRVLLCIACASILLAVQLGYQLSGFERTLAVLAVTVCLGIMPSLRLRWWSGTLLMVGGVVGMALVAVVLPQPLAARLLLAGLIRLIVIDVINLARTQDDARSLNAVIAVLIAFGAPVVAGLDKDLMVHKVDLMLPVTVLAAALLANILAQWPRVCAILTVMAVSLMFVGIFNDAIGHFGFILSSVAAGLLMALLRRYVVQDRLNDNVQPQTT